MIAASSEHGKLGAVGRIGERYQSEGQRHRDHEYRDQPEPACAPAAAPSSNPSAISASACDSTSSGCSEPAGKSADARNDDMCLRGARSRAREIAAASAARSHIRRPRKTRPAIAIERAGRAHRDPPGRPLRQQPEGDAGEMKQAGGNHEAERIGDGVRAFRQFGAMRMTVEDRENADEDRGDRTDWAWPPAPPSGRAPRPIPQSRSRCLAAERRECRARRPAAITSGNTTGRTSIAGMPRNAPQSPTASIAAT